MLDNSQPPEKHSFFVEGEPKEVAKKFSRLYDNTGVVNPLDISEINPELLEKQLGLIKDDISAIYVFNRVGHTDYLTAMANVMFGPQFGAKAVVIGYKSRPGVTEVVPCESESRINQHTMQSLDLKLIEK